MSPFYSSFLSSLLYSLLSAMRDHIDQPKAHKAHQADKNQCDGIYDHAMSINPRFSAYSHFERSETGE